MSQARKVLHCHLGGLQLFYNLVQGARVGWYTGKAVNTRYFYERYPLSKGFRKTAKPVRRFQVILILLRMCIKMAETKSPEECNANSAMHYTVCNALIEYT